MDDATQEPSHIPTGPDDGNNNDQNGQQRTNTVSMRCQQTRKAHTASEERLAQHAIASAPTTSFPKITKDDSIDERDGQVVQRGYSVARKENRVGQKGMSIFVHIIAWVENEGLRVCEREREIGPSSDEGQTNQTRITRTR